MASVTQDELRSYGLSGEPLNWVPDSIRTVVAAIRQSNLAPDNTPLRNSAEFAIMTVDEDFIPNEILLSHPVSAEFDHDVDDMVATVEWADSDLNLPGANVHWDFGDRTGPIFQSTPTIEHTYASPGTFVIFLRISVAGVTFESSATVYAPGDIEPPAPVPPTGVDAGAPGAFTPAGSAIPADLAALQALGALGETAAWAEGEFVTLGDMSEAHWDGDSWEAGAAPTPPPPPEFDPQGHTIQEVKDYINGLDLSGDANPLTQRIVDRERATQNRTTLVEWLDKKLGVV